MSVSQIINLWILFGWRCFFRCSKKKKNRTAPCLETELAIRWSPLPPIHLSGNIWIKKSLLRFLQTLFCGSKKKLGRTNVFQLLDTERNNLTAFLARCWILFRQNIFLCYVMATALPGSRFTFDLNNLLEFKYVPAQLCYCIIFFQLFLNGCCYFCAWFSSCVPPYPTRLHAPARLNKENIRGFFFFFFCLITTKAMRVRRKIIIFWRLASLKIMEAEESVKVRGLSRNRCLKAFVYFQL